MQKANCEKLHSLMRKITHKSRHLQMRHCHGSGDMRLLRIIVCREVGVLPSQLAKKTEVSLPTISQKLSVLEKRGLIERKICEDDRRKTLIYATQKGKALINEGYRGFMNGLSSACEKLGEEKVEQLIEILSEMNEYIDEEIGEKGDRNEIY